MHRKSTVATLTTMAVGLIAVACSSSPKTTSVSGSATTAGGATSTKPVVTVPSGPPPTTLQIKDLVVGTGPAAAVGQQLTMQYVGVAYSTKQQFDASWDRGQPFPFVLGHGQVIKGWDQGLVGMRVGGRRQLIIPPDLGYGASGSPPAIGPNETLIFVVDLVAIG
ncbi:MAG TPA: FKBP-type peptidyl-prolyl cis-trans isomerase [Acidimicrobiales bacterium]|nr:FKBP-type peptidyl-prolyl cis-trans isomerase [Acidimicrobiales bacterium]